MSNAKLESLPHDLLFEILNHLSVQDTLCLRRVSRRFHGLTRERTVWVNAYRKSTVLRPPGPFPSQSAAHLESELKRSIRLHANWISPSPLPVSRRILNLGDDMFANRITLALGRYLLVLGDQALRCYDLDSVNDDAEDRPALPIASFDLPIFNSYYKPIVDSYVDERDRVYESQFSIVCALLFPAEPHTIIQLLDLHISPDTARFELKNEVQVLKGQRLQPGTLIRDFLLIDNIGDPMILHVPTCKLYHLPPSDFPAPSHTMVTNSFGWFNQHVTPIGVRTVCALTSTHLLVQSSGNQNILEAFLLPDDVQPEASQPKSTQQRAVLTRSHIVSHPFCFRQMLFLSHTTLNQDQRSRPSDILPHTTISMTFLVPIISANGQQDISAGFLDIVLESPGGSMSVSCTPGPGVFKFVGLVSGTVQRGCARFVATDGTVITRRLAYTVNGGVGDRTIVTTYLHGNEFVRPMAWDGLLGRLCTLISPTCVKIRDYV